MFDGGLDAIIEDWVYVLLAMAFPDVLNEVMMETLVVFRARDARLPLAHHSHQHL